MAARRPVEAAQDRHQGRFAGTGRPHDGDELAALDREADTAQRMHVDVADVVSPRYILDPDDCFGHFDWSSCHSRGGGTVLPEV